MLNDDNDPLSWVDTVLPPMSTRHQLAAAAGVHVRKVDHDLKAGLIEFIRIGRAVRITRPAARRWFARGMVRP